MDFVPIHNHSEFSALDGLSTCKEIAERCEKIGVGAVGITDHGTVSGHLEFAKEMAKYDIKPIFGCELYHGVTTSDTRAKGRRDQAHFIAGAMTNEGLRNLWRLVDAASENFYFVGRVNWEMLKKYGEGLFATSACLAGLVQQELRDGHTDSLNRYLEIFKDNFYIELHTYPTEEQEANNIELVGLAQERGIPVIYATDAHFAGPEQYGIHDAYVAMQTGETIMTPIEERKMWHPKSLYIQDEAQIRSSLSYLPDDVVDEALRNSYELAEKCQAELPEVKRHLPAFIPSDSPYIEEGADKSAAAVMMQAVEVGLVDKYGENASEEVWGRAEAELEVFITAGLEHYFMQAWDFVQFCNEHDIKRGPGRGSAAGSIVAYALGITDVDPLKYDLIFERFYNPGREKGFPDIDNDFPTKDRPKVKQYMERRWGRDKVRSIGTVTRLKPKSAIDRTHKVAGIDFDRKEQLKKIVNEVPDIDILGADSIGWDEDIDPGKTIYVMDHVGREILEWVEGISDTKEQDRVLEWLELLRVVCSRVSGYGIHPSGIVVSDVALNDELPCMWNTSKKTQVTCFPMTDVDKRMFVKQDFLGLANLDILDEWEKMVGSVDWQEAEEEADPEMWKLLERGLSLGIFQIEDGYARHLCKEFKPESIEDLAIIVALNRPGPIRSGAPESFIRRRRGEEEITYDHPILEEILEPTYGWFLFQEQVIRFFTELGYDLSDADAVRKILGKKKPEDMRALYLGEGEWKGKGYVEVAKPQIGDAAQVIWDKIEDFAKYSFNKSHAVAYAVLGFRTLYAKFNSPAHFFVACIRVANIQQKSKEEAGKYVSEARRMGIKVLPPDIDYSQPDIDFVDGHIYFGFSNIKGIGKAAAEFICKLRNTYEINSVEDLSDAIGVEMGEFETERAVAKAEGKKFSKKSPKQALPANRLTPMLEVGVFARKEGSEQSLKDIQVSEKELLGVIVTDDCEDILAEHFEEVEACDSYKVLDQEEGVTVQIPGIVNSVVSRRTRKDNKAMGIVSIEFEGDQAEFVVFPREWKGYKFLWNERTPAIFTLTKTDRGVRFEGATKLT